MPTVLYQNCWYRLSVQEIPKPEASEGDCIAASEGDCIAEVMLYMVQSIKLLCHLHKSNQPGEANKTRCYIFDTIGMLFLVRLIVKMIILFS